MTQTGSKSEGETGCRLPLGALKGARVMTCLETLPPTTLRERLLAVLETQRLVLRAPQLEDAKTIAALANDRRIAENTARIPHPYRVADAESWIVARGELVHDARVQDDEIGS